MKRFKQLTRLRVISLVISNLIPLAVIVLGIRMLFYGICVNSAFVIGFIVLPFVALIWNLFSITSPNTRYGKIVSCIVFQVIFIIVFLGINVFGKFEALRSYKNEAASEQYCEAFTVFAPMPNLDEIARPQTIEYYDYFSEQAVFLSSDTDVLICGYDKSDYSEQKALLDKKYAFQQEPMFFSGYSCDPVAELEGYVFRFLSVEGEYENQIHYPKQLVIIATNDATGEIVYMFTCCDELDYIESAEDFISESCGWKHIR